MLEPESKVIHATENQNQPNLKFQKNLKLKLVSVLKNKKLGTYSLKKRRNQNQRFLLEPRNHPGLHLRRKAY
jgi:hypothetical protein